MPFSTDSSSQGAYRPLDYGQQEPVWRRGWKHTRAFFAGHLQEGSSFRRGWTRFWTFIGQSIDGLFELIGQLLASLVLLMGSRQQLMLAMSLACLAGGLGLILEGILSGWGPMWMAVGGFLLGTVLPVPRRKTK